MLQRLSNMLEALFFDRNSVPLSYTQSEVKNYRTRKTKFVFFLVYAQQRLISSLIRPQTFILSSLIPRTDYRGEEKRKRNNLILIRSKKWDRGKTTQKT